jgi:hypothetical protein
MTRFIKIPNKLIYFILVLFISISLILSIISNSYAGFKKYPLTEEENIEAKNREFPSIISSNRDLDNNNKYKEDIKEYIAKTKIYDISYVVYSKEYAKKYNLPMEKIYIDNSLPKEIKFMELEITMDGAKQVQYLKILMDNDLNIDIPDADDYIMMSVGKNKLNSPKWNGKYASKEMQEFTRDVVGGNELRYNMNFFLVADTPTDYIGGNMVPMEFSKRVAKDLDYYKFSFPFYGYKRLEGKKPQLCFQKKGGRDLSEMRYVGKKAKISDFHCFLFPKKLIKKTAPILKEIQEPKSKSRDFNYAFFESQLDRSIKKLK